MTKTTEREDRKIDAEIAALIATSIKLNAETDKIHRENRWYFVIVISGATLAIAAIGKLFL